MGWFMGVLQKVRKFLVIEPEDRNSPSGSMPAGDGAFASWSAAEILEYLNSFEPAKAVATVDLQVLRGLVADLERPTRQQIEAFVQHVAQAGSWYKHLPLAPPGQPFHFFLDPFAGMDHVRTRNGGVQHLERREGDREFHYTWMPTAKYRERFGFLSFHVNAGSSFMFPVLVQSETGQSSDGYLTHRLPQITWTIEGTEMACPAELIEAGTVALSGVVHPRAANHEPWFFKPLESSWPDVAGGPELLSKILARARELEQRGRLAEDHEQYLGYYDRDPELERLLEPERQRQRAAAIAAIERMLGLLYDPLP